MIISAFAKFRTLLYLYSGMLKHGFKFHEPSTYQINVKLIKYVFSYLRFLVSESADTVHRLCIITLLFHLPYALYFLF
jgi:hypothetical protein